MSDQLQDDVPSVEIEDKIEPIDIEETTKTATDDEDPRAAIYAKHKERRGVEREGTPLGSEAAQKEKDPEPSPEPDEDVVVKVNGKERKVSKAKVDEAGGLDVYQKRLAAEENLKLANEERRRVQEYEQQLAAKARQLQEFEQQIRQRAQQQPVQSPPVVESGEMKKLAREYHEAILNGDMDQADDLLIKMQGARNTATPDAEQIARRAAAEAKAELDRERAIERQKAFEAERIEAVEHFQSEYSDIADDPELREMADQKTIKLLKANPSWGPKRVIDEAARQVRDWMKDRGMVKESVADDKLAAKRSLTSVRGGTARAMPKAAPKPPSRSQYVENLRKARGLE